MRKQDFKDIETYKQLGLIDAEIVSQNIYANNYELKSLLGSPKEVDGDFFSCSNNKLKNLSFTNNAKLKELQCNSNSIEALALSGAILLENLHCDSNNLPFINISTYNYESKIGSQ